MKNLFRLFSKKSQAPAKSVPDQGDLSRLAEATAFGKLDKIQKFIDTFGSSHIDSHHPHTYPPLISAIIYYQDEAVELLLKNGADINLCDDDGKSPMDHAKTMRDILIAGTSVLIERSTAIGLIIHFLEEEPARRKKEKDDRIAAAAKSGQRGLTADLAVGGKISLKRK